MKLNKEIDYFEKKYSFKINFIADNKLIIPEYKIELLNKSKKIIKIVENIDKIEGIDKNLFKDDKTSKVETKVNLKKAKKTKTIKKKIKSPRTLWVRRKRKV